MSLLSDFEPKGEVARRYGVYRADDGTTERALFVIDAGGIITWSYVSPVGVNPGCGRHPRSAGAAPQAQAATTRGRS